MVGGTDARIRVVDVDTGRTIRHQTLDSTFYTSTTTTSSKSIKPAQESTIIWDIIVLRDGTTVSADSTGAVSFWHGPSGTLIKKFTLHKADALCLAQSRDGSRVFSSGSDRNVIQYSFIETKSKTSSTRKHEWIVTGEKRYHSHDVYTMLYHQVLLTCCIITLVSIRVWIR